MPSTRSDDEETGTCAKRPDRRSWGIAAPFAAHPLTPNPSPAKGRGERPYDSGLRKPCSKFLPSPLAGEGPGVRGESLHAFNDA